MRATGIGVVVIGVALSAAPSASANDIFVGHIADYTGATSTVGTVYGQGVSDALTWLNAHGGVNGKSIEFETVDYSYKAPQAISTYKSWKRKDPAAIQGWGTADTEALVQFVARDEIPYFSASYSGHLTDPTGQNPDTKAPAPYNFFYGPSYSDGCRALVKWAVEDWEKKSGEGQAKYVHMGDNHPYPNAPKAACEAYAAELGMEVLSPIVFSLSPGDFKAQCLTLEDSGADYAFLANTGGSVISLLKSCDTVGVDVQFLANVWGYDRNVMEAAGDAADGVVWVVGAAPWGADVPGMETIRDISKVSDPSGEQARRLHYMRGVCSVFFMRDAMVWADENGGITGPNVKAAMEQMKDHVPAELEGVCLPSGWTETDHRGTTTVMLYRGHVSGDEREMEHIATVDIERRPEWLGM